MKFLKSAVFVSMCALVMPAFAQMTYQQPSGGAQSPGSTGTMSAAPTEAALTQQATVVSVSNVPQYTYIEAKQGDKTIWIATTTVAVKKGDNIRFSDGMEMKNYHSKALNKDFASVFFVERVVAQ